MNITQFKAAFADLINDGSILIEGEQIIGVASDGVRVDLGMTSDLNACARYLQHNGTPDRW